MAHLTKRKEKKTQISQDRTEQGRCYKRLQRKSLYYKGYFKNLYSTKLENLKEIDDFLDSVKVPKIKQEVSNLNRFINKDWNNKNPAAKKSLGLNLKCLRDKSPKQYKAKGNILEIIKSVSEKSTTNMILNGVFYVLSKMEQSWCIHYTNATFVILSLYYNYVKYCHGL